MHEFIAIYTVRHSGMIGLLSIERGLDMKQLQPGIDSTHPYVTHYSRLLAKRRDHHRPTQARIDRARKVAAYYVLTMCNQD